MTKKLTHGAEMDGDSVHIPADHPTFPFPSKGDQQATAPTAKGVHMIVSQLNAKQREALGLPAEDVKQAAPAQSEGHLAPDQRQDRPESPQQDGGSQEA
jgi:hypothetical protein